MLIIEVIGLITFLLLTLVGYRKNNRNFMLFASLILILTLAAPNFVKGFNQGYKDTKAMQTSAS